MKTTRRHVLLGLGALGVGGGALLGSGAFSSTEAQRGVEVNVLADDDIADVVDVLVRAGEFNSVAVTGDGADEDDLPSDTDDASGLFPTVNEFYAIDGFTSTPGDVSLIANDVRLVFGPEDGQLPSNARVTYDQLFVVVNREPDSGSPAYEVTFEIEGEILDVVAYDANGENSTVVASGTTEDVHAEILTAGGSRVNEDELTIRIENA